MSQQGSNEQTQLSTTGQIDRMCDEFEKACRAGRPPLIEQVLMEAEPDQRDRLLAELLEIELDWRQRAHSFVQEEDYRIRFPDRAELVETVFRRVVKTRRLADYELLDELGRGGMGVVYKARQVYLNQVVAVKILPHRYMDDPQAVARFRREMESIGRLSHPNIVRAYNAGEASGVHFLAMEYIDGINLQRLVDIGPRPAGGCPGGPLGVGAACEVVRQAALGLEHAHEHQLVHRDIKPANLMLARGERLAGTQEQASDSADRSAAVDGHIKILDMGLAKFHAESRGEDQAANGLTQPGMTMGTVDYMAPEQWENSATADIRADIYSLGCTLYFLLTGKPPYGEPAYETGRKKLMAHAVAPIPSLAESCGDVPAELQEVFEAMMAKNPRDRYATPAEVADALAEFADGEELAEVIAAAPPHDAGAAKENTGIQGPETPWRQDAGSHPRRRSHSRRTSRQKFRRNVTIGIAAGLTIVVCGVLGRTLMKSHDGRTQTGGTPESSASSMAADTSISREALAAELALLPGLDGRWWFDDMPWLTPFVRRAVSKRVLSTSDLTALLGDRPRGFLTANTAKAHQWLWDVAARCRGDLSPSQQKLMDQLKSVSDENLSLHVAPAQTLELALNQFIDAHRGGEWSGVDLHTVAVLKRAMARGNKSPQGAKDFFDRALKAYIAAPRDGASLYFLCLFDSVMGCDSPPADANDAKRRLDELLGANDLPVMFHVSALVERGRLAAAAANPGEYEEHFFVHAKKLLDGYNAVKPTHPLAAYIAESHAESLLQQWKVEEVGKQLQAAYHIRLMNKDENAPVTAIYVFRDRRLIALAARYRGNLGFARQIGKALVVELKTAIEEAERGRGGGKSIDVRILDEQLAAALETLADCELYAGAAGAGKVNLAVAAENYEQARAARRMSPARSG